MSPSESTRNLDVERPNDYDADERRHSQTSEVWSFGWRDRLVAPLSPRPPAGAASERSAAANSVDSTTASSLTDVDVSERKPSAPPPPSFGKRGFAPLYQWEGVVEEVNGEGFRARLAPVEHGHADASHVEYADFSYDDLADESDHERVMEGAVFYWTVGKSRNAAGTHMNTSLVRFRRLPPPTPSQVRDARRQAEALLADLGADGSN